MRPAPRFVAVVAAGTVLTAAATAFHLSAPQARATSASEASGSQAQDSAEFLGFRVGEERRYVLGPPDSLVPGEAAEWGIFLTEIIDEGFRRVGAFDLVYRRWEPGGLERSKTLTLAMNTRLYLNEHAFPLRVTVNERVWTDDIRADYAFRRDHYAKVVTTPEQEWEFTVPIARQKNLDLEVPSGLYVFRELTDPSDVLAHPALLGLALPRPLPPPGWEQEFLFFTPSTAIRWPNEAWIRRERDQRGNTRRFYSHNDLKIVEETEIEVGDRMMQAYRINVEGAMREVYVDRDGQVLRINLNLGERTRKPTFVRLLFPSEY